MKEDTLAHLFGSRETNPELRHAFETGVGWRYGLVFGLSLTLVAWGIDAAELAYDSAALFWPKLVLTILIVIPLCAGAGALAARTSLGRKILIWTICGGITGWLAIHLPFEGVSALVTLTDPATRGIDVFPFVPGAQERVLFMTAVGALGGVVAGVLQVLATHWAWDRSTQDNRLTRMGWVMLLVSLPFALTLGVVYDGIANAQFRAPISLTNRVIQLALHTPPDLDVQSMETARLLDYLATRSWRSRFSSRYTQYLADFDAATLRSAMVDTAFDDGFIWRCGVSNDGQNLLGCSDLNATYAGYLRDFFVTGDVKCENCFVRIEPGAAEWRKANLPALGDIQDVQVKHHSGGVVLAVARFSTRKQAECRLTGAYTVTLESCAARD